MTEKELILCFYLKKETPACYSEACALRKKDHVCQNNGYVIVQESADSLSSHEEPEKYMICLFLIADDDKTNKKRCLKKRIKG
jgi:peroxiredoxin